MLKIPNKTLGFLGDFGGSMGEVGNLVRVLGI